MQRPLSLVACLLLLGGCGDDSGSNQNNAACPEGYQSQGEVCVPIFDDCSGPAEIALLGGGCQPVGVTTCATGLFEPDGEGGCEPILPPIPDACPPGTMEILGQTTCQPVGVTACATGFVSDGAGGCDAILPAGLDPCPAGSIALLGHTACQPLGDCGSGTWGNIMADPTTVYVDWSADAAGANGTAQAPYVTIADALAVVLPSGQIAVAAGDYVEHLTINKSVRLVGRCAERVTIRGDTVAGEAQAPVTIEVGGSGTTVRDVTLTGPAQGLVISGAQQVVVEQVQVLDASDMGIVAQDEAEVSVRRVVVAGCANRGVLSDGSTMELEGSVVRDTRVEAGTDDYGQGIQALCDLGTGTCGSLRVSASLVSRNRDSGIFVIGVDTEVVATVVRNTWPAGNVLYRGYGINALYDEDVGAAGSLRVTSSVVSDNLYFGIIAKGVDAEITSTVVRDTLPDITDDTGGLGVVASCFSADHCSNLRLTSSQILRSRIAGINVYGATAEITGTEVSDTLPLASTGGFGRGAQIQCHPVFGTCGTVQITSSLFSGNRYTGIFVTGVNTEVVGSVVRGTQSEELTDLGGRGIHAQCSETGVCGSFRLSSSVISANHEVGVLVSGVDAEVTATVVRNTLPEALAGASGRGLVAHCTSSGACGSLWVSASYVSGNRDGGIIVHGVDTEVINTVVRDTLPDWSTGSFGRGISVQCYPDGGPCGRLWVSSSLVRGNENAGIFLSGVLATLTGVAVMDTHPNAQGEWGGQHGQGIWALCDAPTGECGGLVMTSCLLKSSHTGGAALQGVPGFMEASEVRSVAAQSLDSKYGYGMQIGGLEGQQGLQMPSFDVTNCRIRDAKLAGLMYYRARGTLRGSEVSGGENSVVMNEGSTPTILEDNSLSGTITDEPTWASMFPAPSPPPSLPSTAHD